MPVRHFYLLPHYSCNGLFFLFSVCWLHMNEFNSFLGGIKGEKSEGCGLFWYCLRDVVNDDKMISQLSLYMVNLSLYIKVTTLFFVKWQSSFSLLLVKSEKIIFGRYIFRASSSLLISPLVSTKAYCIHSFWSQNTEKRNTTISQMRLQSRWDMVVFLFSSVFNIDTFLAKRHISFWSIC